VNFIKRYPLILCAIVTLAACKKNNPSITKPVSPITPTTTIDSNVYFVGTNTGAYPNNNPSATFWKYGIPNTIADDLSSLGSTPAGVVLNGTDIYIAGSTHIGVNQVATAWKNGIATALADTTEASKAYAIAINNGNIFIAGCVTVANGSQQATVWKNNISSTVPPDDAYTSSEAYAVAINGTDVYMAGFIFNVNKGYYEAAYWKNGVETILSTNTIGSTANGIAVSGNNVYVVGDNNGQATLWQNGTPTTLATASNGSLAKAIALNGSDVYIAGAINGVAAYWKNGVVTILPGGEPAPTQIPGNAIAINASGDVYIASGNDASGNTIYWKNGVSVILTKYAAGLADISGIAIVPH
jgi:hypothetical protein